MSGGLAGGQGLTSHPGEAWTFPNGPRPSPEAQKSLLSCFKKSRTGKRKGGKGEESVPSGSSLTKFSAITSQSRVCVCWGFSAVAKGEELRDSLEVLQSGKGFPPSLPTPTRASPRAGLRVGTRLCWSRDPRVAVPG